MKLTIYSIFFLIIFSSCNSVEEHKVIVEEPTLELVDTLPKQPEVKIVKIDTLEQRIIDAGLVDVQTLNDSIYVDLKYSSTDNFMRENLYGTLSKAYLQKDIAERLANVQTYLSSLDSSLHLLVYDAVRPRSVQWKMWNGLDTIPVAQRIKFVSNPRNGSIHNYGCAVDLTICSEDGIALDVGANYDDLRKIAYPRYEAQFLKSGELTKEQLENRKLLRKVMRKGGFWVLQTEWWHFNGFTRSKAKQLYKPVE